MFDDTDFDHLIPPGDESLPDENLVHRYERFDARRKLEILLEDRMLRNQINDFLSDEDVTHIPFD